MVMMLALYYMTVYLTRIAFSVTLLEMVQKTSSGGNETSYNLYLYNITLNLDLFNNRGKNI